MSPENESGAPKEAKNFKAPDERPETSSESETVISPEDVLSKYEAEKFNTALISGLMSIGNFDKNARDRFQELKNLQSGDQATLDDAKNRLVEDWLPIVEGIIERSPDVRFARKVHTDAAQLAEELSGASVEERTHDFSPYLRKKIREALDASFPTQPK